MMKKIKRYKGIQFMIQTASLEINFGGSNEIDLSTLTVCLENTLKCLKKIADQTINSNTYVKFTVETIKPGSFILCIKEILTEHETFINTCVGISTIFVNILTMRKHLQGKAPLSIKSDGLKKQVNITNYKGKNLLVENNVYNIYTGNNEIEKALSEINKTVNNDRNRTNFKATNKTENSVTHVEYSEEDIASTTNALDVEKFSKDIIEEINVIWLKIKYARISGDGKWEFIMTATNTNISANVEDTEWLNLLHKGEREISGLTKIYAKVRCRYKVDKNGNTESKVSYTILKVLEHKSDNYMEQCKFDFAEE